jgi:integrase
MRGHVVKPKGRNRYYIVVDIGPDPATGKRRQKWHGSWATEKEAEHALPGIVGSLHDGTYVEPERVTVSSFLVDEWLPAVAVTLRPSTVKLYETLANAYVVPRIGQVQLQKLSPGHLNRLYGELLKNGKRDGSPLGAESVGKVHRLIHRAMRDAVKWGRVTRNPAASADPPRAARPEIRAWSAPDLTKFLDQAASDRLAALWHLYATTGLRRAEALGLTWSAVDLDAGHLSVRQTLAYVGTKAVISETKNASSRRLVVLTPGTVAALKAHRARQAEERLSVGAGYRSDLDLVFAHVDGSPLNPSTVSRIFDRLVTEAGLPRITLHGLRHSWATLALLEGIPTKVVAEILGHSSTRVTEDVYQHVTPGMQADATSRVANLFGGA